MEIATMSQAMQLHAQVLKSNPYNSETKQNLSKLFTFSALSPSGDLAYARLILDSLSTPNSYFYNTLIRAYSHSSEPTHPRQALSLFLSMHQNPNHFAPKPDNFTYPFIFKSCARLKDNRVGKQLHGLIFKAGLDLDRYVQHSLIHMYSICGESDLAYKVFDRILERDVVSWTSMIDGFVDDDNPLEAIRLFEEMVDCGAVVNDATIVSVLRACADTGALRLGKRLHEFVEEKKIGLEANVSTALIDMYVKCGSIDNARMVFNDIKNKDVFTWTAMISGYASHGMSQDAIDMFEEMQVHNVKPDERTMTAVLSACRNAGWVSKACAYFKGMRRKYGVRPTIQHYGSIVDCLARAGHLKDAEEFMRKMPVKPDAVMWRTLIWACKVHGDTDRGKRLIEHLEDSNMDCGSYVLLGNVYASTGRWDDKAIVRKLMNEKGLTKPPGSSRIEVDGVISEFSVGDSTHPEAEKIYEKLDEVEVQVREEGHNPIHSEVLLEIDDEEKAFQLRHHSEKLAVAYGLIKTSPSSEIRIVKNMRSCEDCHAVMKLISKIYQREIIMRDRIRFHYFKNGSCSCQDYW